MNRASPAASSPPPPQHRSSNAIIDKPYKWGGGHATLVDTGYDCSGAVSYPLIAAAILASPMVSGDFSRWQLPGPGTWVTTYSIRGHMYMEVAGLRLDTSPYADPARNKGPRWRPAIGARPRFHVRHPAGF